jgi:hypothetical protein
MPFPKKTRPFPNGPKNNLDLKFMASLKDDDPKRKGGEKKDGKPR